jgi:hypothetical protein
MSSELRGMLTRSIGENPTIRVDYNRAALRDHDTVIQCSDGLHGFLAEHELRDCVNRMPPDAACDHLIRLAEKRGSQDNISIQIVRVDQVSRVGYYRGSIAYSAPATPAPVTQELEPGSLLDERFQITDVISRSDSSVFKATDLKTGRPVAVKVPLPSEGDPAFSRFERERKSAARWTTPGSGIIGVDPSEKSRPYIVMGLLRADAGRLMHRVRPPR